MSGRAGADAVDAVVVGAGLAGLACALRLAEAGREVVVLDAADAVGGRQRTDLVDGFTLDRGFQVLNPAYPAVRRIVDVDALALAPLPAGVRVVRDGVVVELAHPLAHPSRIGATLRSGLVTPRDVALLTRWMATAMVTPQRVVHGGDEPLAAAWDRLGLDGPLRRQVLEPFLAGVVAAEPGGTSDAFARLLVRMFALGRPGLPADGIQAVPEQLAARARAAGTSIRTERRVRAIAAAGSGWSVGVEDGDAIRARDVVVAVGPESVAGLVAVPAPRMHGLQTWWFDAERTPTRSRMLHLDGLRRGPVLHSTVISGSAPTWAPPGRALVEATCLLGERPAVEREVRAHLRTMWGAEADAWRLLRRDDVQHALPAQPAPLRATSATTLAPGLHVAGDHRDTASIQGALVSGERVADAVLHESGAGHYRDVGGQA